MVITVTEIILRKPKAGRERCCPFDGFDFYILFSIKLLPKHCVKSYFATGGTSFLMRCEMEFKAVYGY